MTTYNLMTGPAPQEVQAAMHSQLVNWKQDRKGFNVPFLKTKECAEARENALGAIAKQNDSESLYPTIEKFVGDVIKGPSLQPMPTIFDDYKNAGLLSPLPLSALFANRAEYNGQFEATTNLFAEGTKYNRGNKSYVAIPVLATTTGSGTNFRDEPGKAMYDEMEAKDDLKRERDRVLLRGKPDASYETQTGQTATAHGLVNATGINMADWDHNAEAIYAEMQKLIKPLRTKEINAPLTLYISHNFTEQLEDDYKTLGSKSLMERIKANGRIMNIRSLEGLQDNEALVIPMNRRFTDIATSVMYSMVPVPNMNDGTSMAFKHITCYGLRVFTYNGETGLVYGT